VKAIIAYLQSAIRYLETRQTVVSITAGLSQTIKDLEAHSAAQVLSMRDKTLEAARLLKERAEHEEEHLKATKVAQNIKALLG
jgi:hypothetical protein